MSLTNLITNADKVAYASVFPTDKIAAVLEGSFNTTTSVTNRSYTSAGFPLSVPHFRLNHGFGRPLFVEYMWSFDQTNWIDGGSGTSAAGYASIAYSDSNYIWISAYTMPAATTVYYRLILTWIDDYTSAYNYTPQNVGGKQINYDSRVTTPKIYQQGTVTLSTTSGAITDVSSTITHGLGYAPNTKVYIESFSGEVWPLNYGGAGNPFNFDDDQLEGRIAIGTSNLVTTLSMDSANGNRRYWYRIYLEQ